jgi:hypothetical protein
VVEPLPETITVYYSNPSWTEIYCYAWSNSGGQNANWPGELMTYNSETKLWSYEMSSTFDNLIFNNNNGEQTGDLVLMGYTLEKPYWNGSSWTALPGSIVDDGEIIKVYYKNDSWTKFYAYVWDNSNNPKTSWPGEDMTKDTETDFYYYEFSSIYTNIIFHNNFGDQTEDISLRNYSSETPLWNGNNWVALDGTAPENPPVIPNPDGANMLYLLPHRDWLSDGARFVAYVWDNSGFKFFSMNDTNADGIYEVQIPANYANIIFIRMNGAIAENSWNNKWNQTIDLTIPTDDKNLFTIDHPWNPRAGNCATGTWSVL